MSCPELGRFTPSKVSQQQKQKRHSKRFFTRSLNGDRWGLHFLPITWLPAEFGTVYNRGSGYQSGHNHERSNGFTAVIDYKDSKCPKK